MRGQTSNVPSHEAGMPLVWLLHMIRNEYNEQELRVVVINNERVIIRFGRAILDSVLSAWGLESKLFPVHSQIPAFLSLLKQSHLPPCF